MFVYTSKFESDHFRHVCRYYAHIPDLFVCKSKAKVTFENKPAAAGQK